MQTLTSTPPHLQYTFSLKSFFSGLKLEIKSRLGDRDRTLHMIGSECTGKLIKNIAQKGRQASRYLVAY